MTTGEMPLPRRRVSFRIICLFSRHSAKQAGSGSLKALFGSLLLRLSMPIVDLLLGVFSLLLRVDESSATALLNLAEPVQALRPSSASPAPSPSRTTHAASRYAVFLIALCLMAWLPLYAQNSVFEEMPEPSIRLVAAHSEMPEQTAFDISVIEMNAPSYFTATSSGKSQRHDRVSLLMDLEHDSLRPEADLRRYWYEFVHAIAPALTESDMDGIAQDWWSANGNRARKRDEPDEVRDASFKEVRTHFQTLRTANDTQAWKAKQWLRAAQMPGCLESLRIPPQAQGISPLAHLLARDISRETALYAGGEATKLRNTVKRLVVGKFNVEDDAGIAHAVSARDVDALLDSLSSGDETARAPARQRLEDWLKQAIDADLNERAAHRFRVNRPGTLH